MNLMTYLPFPNPKVVLLNLWCCIHRFQPSPQNYPLKYIVSNEDLCGIFGGWDTTSNLLPNMNPP